MRKTVREKKTVFIAAKIPAGVWERLDEFARTREWTTSHAVRSLIARGLEDARR
jgi:hypothetical protein